MRVKKERWLFRGEGLSTDCASALVQLKRPLDAAVALEHGRTLLTLTGVALGIAVVVGVHLANERAIESFNDGLGILNGGADLQIAANGLDLDEILIGELSWV